MKTFTKRDLNQKTAEVLNALELGEDLIIITERGEEKYEIRRREPSLDPLERLRRSGMLIPPSDNPPPMPPIDYDRPRNPERVDRLIDEMKGDH
ncbi:hypothetical protein [Nesterenkonia muleiensis]|uniref:hypothetical protein n=1 Tax=Nesterenkonia muleiensis TaxID=2282648 RepID=UPI000E7509E6|nr:hypothetical protein [Nesterenkonia muleiensis]